MLRIVPKRSTGGCVTCKQRRKKCDERRPYCMRCERGDFDCLGYSSPDSTYISGLSSVTNIDLVHRSLHVSPARPETDTPRWKPLDCLITLPEYRSEAQQSFPNRILAREVKNCLTNIPKEIQLDSRTLENVTSLVVSEYVKLSRALFFKAPLFSIEEELLQRINLSVVTRWSMYLAARVFVEFLNDGNVQKYADWILCFCKRITETSTSNESRSSLEARLNGLHDLVSVGTMVSGTTTGYLLLQCSTPLFLQLAALEPQIWVGDSGISIAEAFRCLKHEIIQFIVHDTITALVLGTPPQLHYDTTSPWVDQVPGHYMESIYGFPVGILILLAQVNAWRASRMAVNVVQNQNHPRGVERRLNNWIPVVDQTDEPSNNIARFAIQEAWRQAAFIYLYMGMSDVNSADPRVEQAVQQVVQLGNTIMLGCPLELHLLLPCLIAGVGARREKHRAALRSKIIGEPFRKSNTSLFPLRPSDFIAVLDHLWHGAGSDGRPVTWEDYVQSRYAILPVT